MDENIALERASQSSFRKAVKNVKNLIKKGTVKVKETAATYGAKGKKPTFDETSSESVGVVYLSHVPHGFYEEQMKSYFSQFGVVTDVTLARSQRTGNSKGFAFVEFLHASVAKVVAETMNNYLMSNRLIKASYLERSKRRSKNLPPITSETCKTAVNRAKNLWKKNRTMSNMQVKKAVTQEKKKLLAIKRKLKTVNGIDLNFEIDPNSLLENVAEEVKQASNTPVECDSGSDDGAPILELDESDFEVTFNPPPGMIVRRVNRSMNPNAELVEAPQQKSKALTPLNKKPSSGKNSKNKKNKTKDTKLSQVLKSGKTKKSNSQKKKKSPQKKNV